MFYSQHPALNTHTTQPSYSQRSLLDLRHTLSICPNICLWLHAGYQAQGHVGVKLSRLSLQPLGPGIRLGAFVLIVQWECEAWLPSGISTRQCYKTQDYKTMKSWRRSVCRKVPLAGSSHCPCYRWGPRLCNAVLSQSLRASLWLFWPCSTDSFPSLIPLLGVWMLCWLVCVP
jgi:hypothetical protein